MTVLNVGIAETINIGQNGTYDVARYTTANVNVSSGKYQLLQRIKDDSNNDVGIVVGFHTYNNVEYAVVCLDCTYRNTDNYQLYSDTNTDIVGLPGYPNNDAYDAPETATYFCDYILNFATEHGQSSTGISQARTLSFVIDGNTHYGQVPTLKEMLMIFMNRTAINTNDPSVIQGSPIIPERYNVRAYLCSTPMDSSYGAWNWSYYCTPGNGPRTEFFQLLPILELPNA